MNPNDPEYWLLLYAIGYASSNAGMYLARWIKTPLIKNPND